MENFRKLLLWIGPIIIAIATALEMGEVFNREYGNLFRYIGIGAFTFGIIIYVVAKIIKNYELSVSIDFDNIDRDDINQVIKLAKKALKQSPSRNEIKSILSIRNDLIVTQKHSYFIFGLSFSKISGFYSLFPIKENAVKGLETEILSARQFTSVHIAGKGQPYQTIYLGGIASKGIGFPIMSYLKAVLIKEREKGIKVIYTKPVTDIGLKLAKKAGFRPVDNRLDGTELERIYKLNL